MLLFKRNLSIILTTLLLSACSSEGGNSPVTGEDGGSYGTGVGYGADGGMESGDLIDAPAGSQEELVATIGDRIFFGFNSANVDTISTQTLDRQAQWLADNRTVSVTVEGHCDERGTREFNLALGEKRATSIKNYLVSKGVNPNRIKVISYGKEHPEYLGSNESSWSKNRRGVTVVN